MVVGLFGFCGFLVLGVIRCGDAACLKMYLIKISSESNEGNGDP